MVARTDKKVKRREFNDALQKSKEPTKKVRQQQRDEVHPPSIVSSSSSSTSTTEDNNTSVGSSSQTSVVKPLHKCCLANLAAKKIHQRLQNDSALFDEVRDIPRLVSTEIRISPNNVLGEGGFGIVREGELLKHDTTTTTKVAVKQVRPILAIRQPTVYANGAADLVTEGEILGRLDHPNIIKLFGVSKTMDFSHHGDNVDKNYFLALEMLQGDTLGKKLEQWYEQTTPSGRRHHHHPSVKEQLELLKGRLQVALQIAKAMQYLHNKNILYRDLKSENVGFAADGTVKLFDFGLAKEIKKSQQQKDKYRLTGNTGSRRYMAPEVAKGWAYNDRVDVYSFAILLWEIAACQRAFPRYTASEFIQRVHQGEERPPLQEWWPVELQWLLKKSWGFFAHSRPDMNVVVETLEEVLEDIDEEVGGKTQAHASHGGSSLRRFIRHTTETFRHSKEGRPHNSHRPMGTGSMTPPAQVHSKNHLHHLPPHPVTNHKPSHRRGGSGGHHHNHRHHHAGLFGFGLFAKHHADQHHQQQQQKQHAR